MIRLASLNQILDPWVYILFRREILQKVIETIKCVCCLQTERRRDSDPNFRRQISQRPSMISLQTQSIQRPSTISQLVNDNMSCFDFCMQCIMYTPHRGRSGSIFTSDGEECMSRRSTLNKSPLLCKETSGVARKLLNGIDKNGVQNNGIGILMEKMESNSLLK